uniref:Uncharacterized protein n=1 Tax=Moniliophthora roreri TaxID=221103 RepID=A0A0W0GBZ5_MONRR
MPIRLLKLLDKAPKSPAIIPNDTDEDNNDKVQIVTSLQEDTEMSEPKGLNAFMHAPNKGAEAANKLQFQKSSAPVQDKKSTNCLITAASIQADLKMGGVFW